MSTQELTTEKGTFLIKSENNEATLFFIEDFTGKIGIMKKEYSCKISSNVLYFELLSIAERLYNEAESDTNIDTMIRNGKPKPNMVYRYTHTNLVHEKELFVKDLLKNGRMFFKMENNSVITVCAPLVGFENKDDVFKSNRLTVEKEFWNHRLTDERSGEDMKDLAKIMLSLF